MVKKFKNNIERQLKIVDSFNRYNGIKMNPKKSKLIVINSSEPENNNYVIYGQNNTLIKPENDSSSIRFLGV